MNVQEKLIVRTEVDQSEIAFIDLKAQQAVLKDRIDGAIQRVLAHGRYIGGPEIDWLEAELAKRTGAADVVGVASGTDALIIPLIGEGIGHGDAVRVAKPFSEGNRRRHTAGGKGNKKPGYQKPGGHATNRRVECM